MLKPFIQGAPSDNLFITNMPPGLEEDDVIQIFGQYGMVQEARVVTKPGTEWTAALIRFSSLEEATNIQDMLNFKIPEGLEKPVSVRFAKHPRNADGTYQNPLPKKPRVFQAADLPKIAVDSPGGTTPRAATSSIHAIRPVPYEPGKRGYYALGGATRKMDSAERTEDTSKGVYGPIRDRASTTVSNGSGRGSRGKGRGKDPVPMDAIVASLEASGALPGGIDFTDDSARIYVRGLPADCTDSHLYQIFGTFGAIMPKGIRAVKSAHENKCIGHGFVTFMSDEAATDAIASLNDTILLDGNTLKVAFKRDVAHEQEAEDDVGVEQDTHIEHNDEEDDHHQLEDKGTTWGVAEETAWSRLVADAASESKAVPEWA
eukprot:TRINITY_DN3527_c0_g4_i1.p1 TRINITY_DN3527_c0_g4~~TRINITY_DN3527_c0_g4_i1.p1  ORF type:complete len:374 (+),score=61.04 TRINITY_DN3527_c0_g4_i1:106-1227(+)